MDFLNTKPVAIVTVTDPDTGNDCEVEIRKIEGGPLVGLDASYLESIGGADPYEEYPVSPYDGTPLHVPDDED
jgi:hypothetical protein